MRFAPARFRRFVIPGLVLVALAGVASVRGQSQSTPAVPRQPPPPAAAPPPAIDPSQPATRPSDDVLASITTEGRRIASYHEAIAKVRARITEVKPDILERAKVFVVDRAGTWHVLVVGREVDGTDARGWLVYADVVFQPRAGEVARLDLIEPPRPAPQDAQATMRALDAALASTQAYKEYRQPFEQAIFRTVGKPPTFVVYLQTRSGAEGFARAGDDLRGVATADGGRMTEFGPLHAPGEGLDIAPAGGSGPTLHTHTTVDLPTATDVATVIDHPDIAPHLV
ncbi:MAG TPA: hypothetical protein VJV75_12295, partial [Candidatus Polarisedimenticolia bacterium]|nr:hypothetical protein [Candidatus Polarisedimenticolia bacterium]